MKEIKKETVKPEKKIRSGAVTATIWLNKAKDKDGKEIEYHTTVLERGYKDKDDEWQNTNSLNFSDIPKAILVMQKAWEYLALKEETE